MVQKIRNWISDHKRETAFLWEHEKEHLEMAIPHFKAFMLLVGLMGLLVIAAILIDMAITSSFFKGYLVMPIIAVGIGYLSAALYIDRKNHRKEIAVLKEKYNYNRQSAEERRGIEGVE